MDKNISLRSYRKLVEEIGLKYCIHLFTYLFSIVLLGQGLRMNAFITKKPLLRGANFPGLFLKRQHFATPVPTCAPVRADCSKGWVGSWPKLHNTEARLRSALTAEMHGLQRGESSQDTKGQLKLGGNRNYD